MIAHVVVDIELRHIPHHSQSSVEVEHQCILAHSLLELVGLDCSSYGAKRTCLDFGPFLVGWLPVILFNELGHLLADSDGEEGGQMPPVVAINGLRHGGVRGAQIEALEQSLHLVHRADANAGLADLAEDIESLHRVVPVQAGRVEGYGEPVKRLILGKEVVALVGALGAAFSSEHAYWQLVLPSEWKYSPCVRE